MKNKGAKIIVNSITMTRVIGTLLMPFISLLLSPGELIFYIIILLLTDSVDGIMARRLNSCTIFGALLDAIADKLLGIATLAVLAFSYPIMFLPIITETLICLINTNGAARGSSTESSFLGKFKTWLFGIAIVVGFCTIYSESIITLFNDTTRNGLYMIDMFNYIIDNKDSIMVVLASITARADIMVAADYRSRNKSDIKKARENGLNASEFKLKNKDDLMFALFDTDYYNETRGGPLLQRLGEEKKSEKKNRRK